MVKSTDMNPSVLTNDLENGGGTIGLVNAEDAPPISGATSREERWYWRDMWNVGPRRQRCRYTGGVRGAQDERRERRMTLDVNDAKKRADL